MSFKIGFTSENINTTLPQETAAVPQAEAAPRKSVVQIYFADRNMILAYYNDRFDLKVGDWVYVDGKLEGLRGRVTSVNYNFKIKLSAYQRVIAKIDTDVHGAFFHVGSHVVTFDRHALPAEQVITWFRAPLPEEEEIAAGFDDTAFSLDNLEEMHAESKIVERGHDYYMENRVRYLCIDDAKGYAIVEGTDTYEVEFEFRNRTVKNLTCSCFCSYPCKPEVAAMLQLRESLDRIAENYKEEYEQSAYLALLSKNALFSYVLAGKETGSLSL